MDATTTTEEGAADAPMDTDDGAMFAAAAGGDHDAQAALALHAQQHGLDGLVPITDAFACAEMFARMAVTSGKVEHILILAKVLANRYDIIGNSGLDDGSLAPLTEYYLLMKIAADAGDRSAMLILKTMFDIAAVAPVVENLWAEIETNPLAQVGATDAVPKTPQAEAPAQAPADAG